MHDYRKLRVYELAVRIVESTYDLTRRLPSSERYGLSAQMNRASVSISVNIAEGAGRGDRADFARFLRIARGSAAELETLALLAHRLGYVDAKTTSDLRQQAEAAKAGITKLERSLSARRRGPPTPST